MGEGDWGGGGEGGVGGVGAAAAVLFLSLEGNIRSILGM